MKKRPKLTSSVQNILFKLRSKIGLTTAAKLKKMLNIFSVVKQQQVRKRQ